jgi:hypothetical protein
VINSASKLALVPYTESSGPRSVTTELPSATASFEQSVPNTILAWSPSDVRSRPLLVVLRMKVYLLGEVSLGLSAGSVKNFVGLRASITRGVLISTYSCSARR